MSVIIVPLYMLVTYQIEHKDDSRLPEKRAVVLIETTRNIYDSARIQRFTTLPQAQDRTTRDFGHRGIHIFDGHGRKAECLTFGELRDGAVAVAARLYRLDLRPGDPVLLALPTSWNWLDTWFGAMLCGALPVAIAVPGTLGLSSAHVARAAFMLDMLDSSFVTTPAFKRRVTTMASEWAGPELVFVKRGRIPRTSSGKVQRHALSRQCLEGSLPSLPI